MAFELSDLNPFEWDWGAVHRKANLFSPSKLGLHLVASGQKPTVGVQERAMQGDKIFSQDELQQHGVFDFRSVSDAYRAEKATNPDLFNNISLSEYAWSKNRLHGYKGNDPDAPFASAVGESDNALFGWKALSAGLDRAVEFTGIPQYSGRVAKETIGKIPGLDEHATQVAAESWARMGIDMAPMLLSGGATAVPQAMMRAGTMARVTTGVAPKIQKFLGAPTVRQLGPGSPWVPRVISQGKLTKEGAAIATGGMFALNTYEKSGSGTDATIAGALGAVIPNVFGAGRRLGLAGARRLGAPVAIQSTATGQVLPGAVVKKLTATQRKALLAQGSGRYLAENTKQRLAESAGGWATITAAFEGVGQAQYLAQIQGQNYSTQDWWNNNPWKSDGYWTHQLVHSLPFLGMDASHIYGSAKKSRIVKAADRVARDINLEAETVEQARNPDVYFTPTEQARQLVAKGFYEELAVRHNEVDAMEGVTDARKLALHKQLDQNAVYQLVHLRTRPIEELNDSLFGELLRAPEDVITARRQSNPFTIWTRREGERDVATHLNEFIDKDPTTITAAKEQMDLVNDIVANMKLDLTTDRTLFDDASFFASVHALPTVEAVHRAHQGAKGRAYVLNPEKTYSADPKSSPAESKEYLQGVIYPTGDPSKPQSVRGSYTITRVIDVESLNADLYPALKKAGHKYLVQVKNTETGVFDTIWVKDDKYVDWNHPEFINAKPKTKQEKTDAEEPTSDANPTSPENQKPVQYGEFDGTAHWDSNAAHPRARAVDKTLAELAGVEEVPVWDPAKTTLSKGHWTRENEVNEIWDTRNKDITEPQAAKLREISAEWVEHTAWIEGLDNSAVIRHEANQFVLNWWRMGHEQNRDVQGLPRTDYLFGPLVKLKNRREAATTDRVILKEAGDITTFEGSGTSVVYYKGLDSKSLAEKRLAQAKRDHPKWDIKLVDGKADGKDVWQLEGTRPREVESLDSSLKEVADIPVDDVYGQKAKEANLDDQLGLLGRVNENLDIREAVHGAWGFKPDGSPKHPWHVIEQRLRQYFTFLKDPQKGERQTRQKGEDKGEVYFSDRFYGRLAKKLRGVDKHLGFRNAKEAKAWFNSEATKDGIEALSVEGEGLSADAQLQRPKWDQPVDPRPVFQVRFPVEDVAAGQKLGKKHTVETDGTLSKQQFVQFLKAENIPKEELAIINSIVNATKGDRVNVVELAKVMAGKESELLKWEVDWQEPGPLRPKDRIVPEGVRPLNEIGNELHDYVQSVEADLGGKLSSKLKGSTEASTIQVKYRQGGDQETAFVNQLELRVRKPIGSPKEREALNKELSNEFADSMLGEKVPFDIFDRIGGKVIIPKNTKIARTHLDKLASVHETFYVERAHVIKSKIQTIITLATHQTHALVFGGKKDTAIELYVPRKIFTTQKAYDQVIAEMKNNGAFRSTTIGAASPAADKHFGMFRIKEEADITNPLVKAHALRGLKTVLGDTDTVTAHALPLFIERAATATRMQQTLSDAQLQGRTRQALASEVHQYANPKELKDMEGVGEIHLLDPEVFSDMIVDSWDAPALHQIYGEHGTPSDRPGAFAHARFNIEEVTIDGKKYRMLHVYEVQSTPGAENAGIREAIEKTYGMSVERLMRERPDVIKELKGKTIGFGDWVDIPYKVTVEGVVLPKRVHERLFGKDREGEGEGGWQPPAKGSSGSPQTVTLYTHPLIPHYERLLMQGAIKAARDKGLDGVVVPDPETAMMTQGHDMGQTAEGGQVRRHIEDKISVKQFQDAMDKPVMKDYIIDKEIDYYSDGVTPVSLRVLRDISTIPDGKPTGPVTKIGEKSYQIIGTFETHGVPVRPVDAGPKKPGASEMMGNFIPVPPSRQQSGQQITEHSPFTWRFEQSMPLKEPRQAGGMRAAYGEKGRLGKGLQKLTGSKPKKVYMGESKRKVESSDAFVEPAGPRKGEPKTSVTGSGYLLKPLEDSPLQTSLFQRPTGSGAEGVRVSPIAKPLVDGVTDFLMNVGRRAGLKEPELMAHINAQQKLIAMFPKLAEGMSHREITRGDVSGAFEPAGRGTVLTNVEAAYKHNNPTRARFTVAHELGHGWLTAHKEGRLESVDSAKVDRMYEAFDAMSEHEARLVMHEIIKKLPKELQGSVAKSINESEGSFTSTPEALANTVGVFQLALATPKSQSGIRDLLVHLPKQLSDGFRSMIRFFRDGVGMLRQLGKWSDKGLVRNTKLDPLLKQTVEDFYSQVKATARIEKELMQAEKQLEVLSLISPTGYASELMRVHKDPSSAITSAELQSIGGLRLSPQAMLQQNKARKLMGLIPEAIKKIRGEADTSVMGQKHKRPVLSTLNEFIEGAHQLAELHPEFKPLIHLTTNVQQEVKRMTAAVYEQALVKRVNGKFVEAEDYKHFDALRDRHTPESKAVNQIARWQQDHGMIIWHENQSHKKAGPINKTMRKLTPKQRDTVIGAMEAAKRMHLQLAKIEVTSREHVAKLSIAGSLMARMNNEKLNANLSVTDAQAIAGTIWQRARLMLPNEQGTVNPAHLQQAAQLTQELMQRISPEVLGKLEDHALQGAQAWSAFAMEKYKHPGYFTERRLGRYGWRYKIDGKSGMVSGATPREAKRMFKEAVPDESVLDGPPVKTDFGSRDRIATNQRMLEMVRKVDAKNKEELITALESMGLSTKDIGDLDVYFDSARELNNELLARDLAMPGLTRKFAHGREQLNMFQNQLDYMEASIKNEAMLLLSRQEAVHILDPILQKKPNVLKRAQQHLANFKEPDTLFGSRATKAAFTWFLGVAPSSIFLEGHQAIAGALAANLTADGAGIAEGYKRIGTAIEKVGSRHAPAGGKKTYGDAELDSLFKMADRNGLIDNLGHAEEFQSQDPAMMQRAIRPRQLNLRPEGVTENVQAVAKFPFKTFEAVGVSIYKVMTRFNARVALHAGFNHYRDKILQGQRRPLTDTEFAEVYESASHMNFITNFAGGKSARPIKTFSGKGGLSRTGAQMVTSLQSYVTGMWQTWARTKGKGWKDEFAHLPPKQRAANKKAFVQLVGTQLTFAGALGIPGFIAAQAIIKQVFGYDAQKDIEEVVGDILQADTKAGAVLTEVALRGVGAMLPYDLSSRFSLGTVMGVSPYEGVTPMSVLGPFGRMFDEGVSAGQAIGQGEWGQALEHVAPQGLKKPINLARNDGEIRSRDGQQMIENQTPMETLGYAIGVTPTRLARSRRIKQIENAVAEKAKLDDSQFTKEVVALFQAGKIREARELLRMREELVPGYTQESGAAAAARLIEKHNFPYNPLNEATRRTGPDMEKLMRRQLTVPDSSGVKRYLLRKHVEMQLGVPGQGIPSESGLTQEIIIDMMRKRDPRFQRTTGQQMLKP